MSPQYQPFSIVKTRILSFSAIGGIGFAVDAGILQTLFSFGIQPLMARGVSFPVAVTATWLLNKRYTFRDRPHSGPHSRYFLYVSGQIAGALVNVCAFVLAIRHWPTLSARPVIPLMVGSALGLIFNYTWANMLVFKKTSLTQAANEQLKSSAQQ
jgi:putative flippase GtrA